MQGKFSATEIFETVPPIRQTRLRPSYPTRTLVGLLVKHREEMSHHWVVRHAGEEIE